MNIQPCDLFYQQYNHVILEYLKGEYPRETDYKLF